MTLLEAIQTLPFSSVANPAAWAGIASFALCLLLVFTQRWHGRLSWDSSVGVQKVHAAPTPRVGGLPIYLALASAYPLTSPKLAALLGPILLAGLPAFLFGLAEDLTKRVGVMHRLLATIVSGLLAWWLTGYALTGVDVWGVDWLLQYAVVSVLFTAIAVGGVANAFNIVDGLNGLAGSAALMALLGFGLIAWQVGDAVLVGLCLVFFVAVAGFFFVNWPLGRIFLGDGGAYFLGFVIAWVAVMLVERNPSVSAFAALAVCAHPVIEVLFTIYRRKIKRANPGHPDSLHFHSLLKRRYVRRWASSVPVEIRNSIAGLIVGAISFFGTVLANLVYGSDVLSFLVFLGIGLAYVGLYARMVRHHWCSPFAFLIVKP